MSRQLYEKSGRRAEFWAKFFLRLKGYQILAECYKTKVGEIDLIARKASDLVFIEVKRRATLKSGEEALTHKTRHRVTATAKIYVARFPVFQSLAMRFDAILISPKFQIRHIRDAWRSH